MDDNYDLFAALREKMPALSKGQKRIAAFLLDNYDKAVYLTAAKLGDTTNVSESTVVRFAIEMGFDGYPKMQKCLEALAKTKLTATQRVEVSEDRLNKSDKHILKAVMQSDADRILRSLADIDAAVFDRAAAELASARRVYIIGGRGAASIAGFLSFNLGLMLDNVININAAAGAETFEQIFRIQEGDVCVGISFPRYSERTVEVLKYANSKKATVIALTDSPSSPIAAYASLNLIVRSGMVSFADSLVAPLSVINALLVAVSINKKDEVINNLNRLEEMWSEYHVYARSVEHGKDIRDE